ncbi:MAG TPA: acyl-CoA dehydrogenase family protein [Quisquiliibacterium sp.]|nr:acyl-CoA dehydrogenase family protein [Quisquiliibacterium sp.]
MEFDFSPEQKQLKEQARRFLADRCDRTAVRAVLDGPQSYDAALWKGLAEQGFLGAAIPEAYGGLGAGYLEACVIAEELGRAVAPVPYSSSIGLAAELLLRAGTEEQKRRYLPGLASGELIGTLALAERAGKATAESVAASVSGGKLSGLKLPVADGDIAHFAVVAARGAKGGLSLHVVDLGGAGVKREALSSVDPTRSQARIEFSNAPAEPLGADGEGAAILADVMDRAAVLMAFEQVGGADRALETARDYALERFAFGRPIGSLQAIKHMLADMYVSATLARSNSYYGAWALSTGSRELPEAAATARVSATQAYQHCARNNIQVHGGMGFTWEFDCHLHYRRSNLLALALGSLSSWEDKLVERLRARRAA